MAVASIVSGLSFNSFAAVTLSMPSLSVTASLWLLSALFETAVGQLPAIVAFTGESDFSSTLTRADDLIEKDELAEARILLSRMEATGCEEGYIQGRLGIIESKLGNTPVGIQLFNDAIQACPPSDPFHHQTKIMLAIHHINAGNYAEARDPLAAIYAYV